MFNISATSGLILKIIEAV